MAEDIYEEAKIKIKATLKEGGIFSKDYTGKLDLIYQKNGTEIKKDADIDVPKGSVDREYDVPLVASTEVNYNLKVIAHYGKTKEKSRVLVDATVWPKKVKLTAKDLKDDSLVKNLPYSIVHTKGGTVKGFTNDVGVGNEDLKKSVYSIDVKAPWELVSNKNDTHKREHDVVVRNNPVAKFLKPDITKECYVSADGGDKALGVRQYVNMTSTEEGCDAKGNIVEFEVCNKDQPAGISGEKIYIKVTFSKLSKRNTPVPALLAPCQGIASSNGGKTLTGFVQLDANGGSGKFKLEMGYAGGETFTVSCGYSKKDPSDAKLIFVTWRKLGYQLRFPPLMKPRLVQRTRPDASTYYDLPNSIQLPVTGRLAPVFVEYENIKSHEYPDPAADAAAMVTKGFMDLSADATPLYVLDGSQNWAVTATAFDAAADNREIHVTLCDRAYSSGGKVLNPTFPLKQVETEMNIDAAASYIYFVKTPKQPNTDNFKIAGYDWTADLSGVAEADKNRKPSFDQVFQFGMGGGPRSFTISEPTVGGPGVIVTCDTNSVLPDTEKAKIKTYYEACFTNQKPLRQANNEMHFKVVGSSGNPNDDVRQAAVVAALNDVHTTSDKKTLFHPGLDDDGNPRTGPMSDVTITHINGRKKKFSFATGAQDKPGEFVGDPSDTKCPVNIEFSMDGTYAINGNAGGGSQLLVLRDHVPRPCASTVCHELGHSMGMSVMPLTGADAYPVPPGLTTPKHVDNGGWYYLDSVAPFTNGIRNLHRGPHCANGMPSSKKSDPKFQDWDPSGSERVCIMWGCGGNEDTREKYCDVCTEILKARRLTDVRGNWAGRADG